MNRLFLFFITLFMINSPFLEGQKNQSSPKLVVGIVVDQMRYDYLYRFNSLYSDGGFKKLIKEGSNFTFAHFNYAPTHTAPGHATIYTGTTPYFHGIISNSWYDKKLKRTVYCTSDRSYNTVGANDNRGQMSPKRLLSTTITDQLKLATNGKSKVISIAIKDRAAILPGGHFPDGVYWYDPTSGGFITSSFYMKKLPGWVEEFNSMKLVDKYMSSDWELTFPLKKYWATLPDNEPYEEDLFSENKNTFPHSFKNISVSDKRDLLRSTPFGNKLLYDFSIAALKNEKLGLGKYTDFLAVSFSSTDYIGHSYGPNSVEVEDTYVKLDLLIAKLINELNKQVGEGNYILFLTSDHGVVENPNFLKKRNIPSGWVSSRVIRDSLKSFSKRKFNNDNVIEKFSSKQIFLNYSVINSLKLKIVNVRREYAEYLLTTFPFIAQTFTRDDLIPYVANRATTNLILNGFNPMLSGDVLLEFQPGYIPGSSSDHYTTHGSSYSYDTHVPLIFYGWNIPKQTINKPVYIVDIAPTIADLLNITEPSGNIGIPLIMKN
ncbi:MAG: alkaline phosphatase family protein [Bacteroidetes bacterium]|nr:alkaline phosphatase family protein [Bacteroidota bacterium]